MKKLFLMSFLFVFVFACSKTPDTKVSSEIVNSMHMAMMASPYSETTNPDSDFLVNMIPHHQGAIDSSKKMLEVGKSEEVITLSKNIIAAQETEIAQFKKVIEDLKTNVVIYSDVELKKYNMESKKIMDDMMKGMTDLKLTGDTDIDFLNSMIIHHEGAVYASNKILEITKNQTIIDIAKKIVMDQEKEITEIKKLSKKLEVQSGM